MSLAPYTMWLWVSHKPHKTRHEHSYQTSFLKEFKHFQAKKKLFDTLKGLQNMRFNGWVIRVIYTRCWYASLIHIFTCATMYIHQYFIVPFVSYIVPYILCIVPYMSFVALCSIDAILFLLCFFRYFLSFSHIRMHSLQKVLCSVFQQGLVCAVWIKFHSSMHFCSLSWIPVRSVLCVPPAVTTNEIGSIAE